MPKDLSNKNDYELLKVIGQLVDSISESSTLIIRDEICVQEKSIPYKLSDTIFKIIQEQLDNVIKHASAKTVYLKLFQGNSKIILSIKDDGVGVDNLQESSGGLLKIKESASLVNGKMDIISSPGNGYELVVIFG